MLLARLSFAGTVFGLLSAVFSSLAFLCIRYIKSGEPALVLALWFHATAATTSSVPLAVGWPQPAVLPSGHDVALLLGVAASSFCGQILLNRGFQVQPAAIASAINCTQVRPEPHHQHQHR